MQTIDLSEQQLTDCVYTSGCNGGWYGTAYDYIKEVNVSSESVYPYTATDGNCRASSVSRTYTLKSHKRLEGGSCDAIMAEIYNRPFPVAVYASNWGGYSSGIFSDCGSSNPNHGVQLVGVDSYGNFKIKNSWGTGFGEGGFMWIANTSNCNICLWPANSPYVLQ